MAHGPRILFLLPLFAFAAFGGSPAFGQDQAGEQPRLVAHTCPEGSMASGVKLDCFLLRVPEHREAPASAILELPVLVFSQDLLENRGKGRIKSKPDTIAPLIYLHGGPGGRLLSDAASTIDTWSGVLRILRGSGLQELIILTQRGTDNKRARAMDCAGLRSPEVILGKAAENIDDDSAELRTERSLKACALELASSGIDLAGYSTLASAQDLTVLLDQMNLETVNLLGLSYGARLAVAFAAGSPERVAKIVLDSPDPLGRLIPFEQAHNLARSLDAIEQSCRGKRQCAGLGKRFSDNLDTLRRRAGKDGLRLTLTREEQRFEVRLGAISLLDVIFSGLYQKTLIESLPLALDQAVQGDNNGLERLAEANYLDRDGPVMWTNIAVSCNDYGAARILETIRRDARATPRFADFVLARGRAVERLCVNYLGDPKGMDWSLDGDMEMPVLIFTGGLDPVTPPAAADYVAGLFKSAVIRTYPEASHGILGLSGCAWRDMTRFLQDAEQFRRGRRRGEICNDFKTRLRFQSAD